MNDQPMSEDYEMAGEGTTTFKFYTGRVIIDWDAALRETARKFGLEGLLPPPHAESQT